MDDHGYRLSIFVTLMHTINREGWASHTLAEWLFSHYHYEMVQAHAAAPGAKGGADAIDWYAAARMVGALALSHGFNAFGAPDVATGWCWTAAPEWMKWATRDSMGLAPAEFFRECGGEGDHWLYWCPGDVQDSAIPRHLAAMRPTIVRVWVHGFLAVVNLSHARMVEFALDKMLPKDDWRARFALKAPRPGDG